MTKHYYTKKLDIPQDADSVRFPIPEGYTASIEDGVFVLVPKEDNDEKTRKELLEVIRHCYEDGGYTLCTDDYKKYSSYLEKQKPADLPPGFYFINRDGKRYYSKEVHYGDMKLKLVENEKSVECSDDEKIRSALLRGFNAMLANQPAETFYGESIKDIISYLEKQKKERVEVNGLPNDCEDTGLKLKECNPEFSFGEDEKIRKDLISLVNKCWDRIGIDHQEFSTRGEMLAYIEKQKEQKSEWNEEDEIYLQDALWCVKQASKVARGENDMGACWSAERWLKFLKNRGNSPKSNTNSPNWSDGDTIHLTNAILAAEKEWGPGSCTAAWLKSLRDRWVYLSWKPSEEQMKAFDMVLTDESMDDNVRAVLTALKNKLQNQCKNG